MSHLDYAVLIVFFLYMTSLGVVFRNFSKNSSDYFRGGGNVLWWLVGATAFMCQKSAWTFTGAASKAYTDGLLVAVIFFGNGIGYFIAYLWSAARFRQMRVVTPMEAIRDRFGRGSEQFFTWMWLPIGTLQAGIWLNAASAFAAPVFGMNLETSIVLVGLGVVFISAVGGAWAIVASDFMQMLILMLISVVAAFLAVEAVGGGSFLTGATTFVDKLPPAHLDWTTFLRPEVLTLWIMAALLKQFCTTNNINDSNRFLYSKDSKNARRAALLASVLFLIGPILWFIPPMASAILYPDLSVIPALKPLAMQNKLNDGAYVAIGLQTMPVGMIGLLVAAIFCATVSTMEPGLNKNAGIFVMNFYKPILRKHASERECLFMGKLVSVVFGMLVILVALFYETLKTANTFNLFQLMMGFSTMVAVPFLIPLIWGIIIKRTPSWSGWSTVLVGYATSLYSTNTMNSAGVHEYVARHAGFLSPLFDSVVVRSLIGLDPDTVRRFLGLATPFTAREMSADNYYFFVPLFFNVCIGSLWFLATTLFARFNKPEYSAQEEAFFKRVAETVIADPEKARQIDRAQLRTLGVLGFPYGGFVLLLALVPNPLSGRLCFVFVGGVILLIAAILYRASRKMQPPPVASHP